MIISPDDYNGSDWQKIEEAIEAAIAAPGGTVDLGVREYTLDRAVDAVGGTFKLIGSGSWHQVTHNGDGPAFSIIGCKDVRIERVGMVITQSGSTGWQVGGDSHYNSCSRIVFDQARVQCKGTDQTGFLIGVGPDGVDTSYLDFRSCDVFSNEGEVIGDPHKTWQAAVATRCVGYAFVGSNTLACSMRDCRATGILKGVSMYGHKGMQSGGNGMQLDNYCGSFVGVACHADGGFNLSWDGGRFETSSAALLHGDPGASGRQKAVVSLRGLTVDDCFMDGIPGLLAPREVFGFRSASKYSVENSTLRRIFHVGDVGSGNIFLASGSSETAYLRMDGFRLQNLIQGSFSDSPMIVAPKAGAWRRTVDGATLPGVQVPV